MRNVNNAPTYAELFTQAYDAQKELCAPWRWASSLDEDGEGVYARLWLELTDDCAGKYQSRLEIGLHLEGLPHVYVTLYIGDNEGEIVESVAEVTIPQLLQQGLDFALAYIKRCRESSLDVQDLNRIEVCIDTSCSLPGDIELVRSIDLPGSIPANPSSATSTHIIPDLGPDWF
jgi:hypothetical protein